MSEEEKNKLFEKAFANTLRKLAEEPEELFDNDKLRKKYNNLLKEHIKLKQELQQKENIIKEAKEYIDKWKFEVSGNGACMEYEDIQDILKILDKGE